MQPLQLHSQETPGPNVPGRDFSYYYDENIVVGTIRNVTSSDVLYSH